jgi:anaerobic ribonucleoside-triphosphate reductase activating protein
MDIFISRLHFPVTTLGPGRRIGIWLQGCSIRCPGCISANTWAPNKGQATVEGVMAHLAEWLPAAEGITISGGEPFDQPEALVALLAALRRTTSADILVYSGKSIEQLVPVLRNVTEFIDALISDPFDLNAPQTMPLRGSDNQRLHLFTAVGIDRFSAYSQPSEKQDKSLDVMFDPDGSVWFAGIPKRGDFLRLQELLTNQGHRVHISADKARTTKVHLS